jgi:hypothetical protein
MKIFQNPKNLKSETLLVASVSDKRHSPVSLYNGVLVRKRNEIQVYATTWTLKALY